MEFLEPILNKLIAQYGEHLVRLKGLIFDPSFDHPLLVQGSIGILHPPAHLPARASDDFISCLVFIMDGSVDGLADDVIQQIQLSPQSNTSLEFSHV